MSISEILSKIREARNTRRGQNILTFAIFLLIATAFWFMMMLNDEVQRNYKVDVVVEDLPDGFTMLNKDLPQISAIVRSRGRSLIKYSFGAKPILRLDYSDFKTVDDRMMIIDLQSLTGRMRSVFGNEVEIVSMRPDSILINYTTRPGEPLPVYSMVEAMAAPQYIIYGPMKLSPDTVLMFSPKGTVVGVSSLSTEKLALKNLSDTTTVEVDVKIPSGCKVVPSAVKVTIPVEPLIAKSRNIKIKAAGNPKGVDVLTFPATAKISYLLPMSLYSRDTYAPSVYVDYSDVLAGHETLQLHTGSLPDYYRNVEISPASVEFLVEKSE